MEKYLFVDLSEEARRKVLARVHFSDLLKKIQVYAIDLRIADEQILEAMKEIEKYEQQLEDDLYFQDYNSFINPPIWTKNSIWLGKDTWMIEMADGEFYNISVKYPDITKIIALAVNIVNKFERNVFEVSSEMQELGKYMKVLVWEVWEDFDGSPIVHDDYWIFWEIKEELHKVKDLVTIRKPATELEEMAVGALQDFYNHIFNMLILVSMFYYDVWIFLERISASRKDEVFLGGDLVFHEWKEYIKISDKEFYFSTLSSSDKQWIMLLYAILIVNMPILTIEKSASIYNQIKSRFWMKKSTTNADSMKYVQSRLNGFLKANKLPYRLSQNASGVFIDKISE